jgi:hypothetical protein
MYHMSRKRLFLVVLILVVCILTGFVSHDLFQPRISLAQVRSLTDSQLFWDNIKYRWQKPAYELKFDPQADPLSVYRGIAVRSSGTGTYLYPNQTELVELMENNKSYQVVRRIPIDSYGFPKEQFAVQANSLEIRDGSVWFRISPQSQGSPANAFIEQLWWESDRPYHVYQTDEFYCYALDSIHRRIFLFRPYFPLIQVYDLSDKKVTTEYQLKTGIRWGDRAFYDPTTDLVLVETQTQYGGKRVSIFNPNTGQLKVVCKGRDIQLGPDKSFFFMSGKKLHQYWIDTGVQKVVYSAPITYDTYPGYWVGEDPHYVQFGYCGKKSLFNSYGVNIDLHKNEYQLTQFDGQTYFAKMRTMHEQHGSIDRWDESQWIPVE